MQAVLTLQQVSKSFGAVVVADALDFQVQTGEALGIVGPNGAGKTSMFNLVAGTLRPDGGGILFNGRDITADPAPARCRAGIARSFQIPQPFGGMSVFENMLVAATQGANQRGAKANAICLEILELTDLLPKANAAAGSLTLLERKRLELARALSAKPKLLLLDEIAGGLTEHECDLLIDTIKTVRKQGVSIMWIEHVVHALLAVVDRLIVIDFGKVIAQGDPHATMASREVQEIYMGTEPDG